MVLVEKTTECIHCLHDINDIVMQQRGVNNLYICYAKCCFCGLLLKHLERVQGVMDHMTQIC